MGSGGSARAPYAAIWLDARRGRAHQGGGGSYTRLPRPILTAVAAVSSDASDPRVGGSGVSPSDPGQAAGVDTVPRPARDGV